MTAVELKSHLKQLIEKEKDEAVLDLVENVLRRRTKGIVFDSSMLKRALRAEQDIKAGRTQPWEEVDKELTAFITELYKKKERALPKRTAALKPGPAKRAK